jgi:hypothetical protein
MEALKDATRNTAIENAWNTSPLTNMYDEHQLYVAASRIQALFRRLEFKAYRKMTYDPYCNHPEIHFMRGVRLAYGDNPADFILRQFPWSFFAVHRPKRSRPLKPSTGCLKRLRVTFNILRYGYPCL